MVLVVAVFALGSGALRYVHELDHLAREHDEHDEHHHEDTGDCFVHAQLNLPMLSGGWTPPVVCIGLLTAFLPFLTAAVLSRRPLLLLDSRGPPVG
jgi:hypothetical protein